MSPLMAGMTVSVGINAGRRQIINYTLFLVIKVTVITRK